MSISMYDTVNLRYNACFKTEIYPNVFWVPVNTLGATRYSLNDITDILKKNKSMIKSYIGNLYEAIQIFQMGNFEIINDDAQYIDEEGMIWEYHRPGKSAFYENKGCCAASGSWASYTLAEVYDEIGLITITSLSGNGHVVNYIFHNSNYYIFDMYVMSNTYNMLIPIETGNLEAFRKTKFITGVLIKTKCLEAFAEFFSRFMYFKSKEYLFLKHRETDCCPVGIKKGENTFLFYPENKNISVIEHKRMNNHIEAKAITKAEKNIIW